MPKKHVTIPFFIPHHGCKHRCVFCNQNATTHTFTLPTEEYITQKIETYIKTIRQSVTHIEVAFFGGSFTGLPKEIQKKYLAIAHTYYSLEIINGIRISTRPDYIDNDILYLLYQYNVTTVELGAQSLHDDVLQLSQRHHTINDIILASRLIKQSGFNLIIQLMPGLPGDTFEKSLASAQSVVALKPDGVRIYPTVVIKNTELENLYHSGVYIPLSLEEAVFICSELYGIFVSNNIPIIRMGLHPFDSSTINTIIAGPYHPSFGYLVKSRYFRTKLQSIINQKLQTTTNIKSLTITLPNKNANEYFGPRKENLAFLRNVFYPIQLFFHVSHVEDPEII